MVARAVTVARSSVACFVMLMVLGGCDSELWQPNTYQDNPGAPSGGEEFVRIFVSWEENFNYLAVDDLVPIEVERVSHERDDPAFDETRVRCVRLSILATGSLITGLEGDGGCQHAGDAGPDSGAPADGLCEVNQLTFNLDRGGTLNSWVRSRAAGTGLLRAEVFSQRCSTLTDASVIAHDEVRLRFVSTGDDTPDVPTDGDADADDEWGY